MGILILFGAVLVIAGVVAGLVWIVGPEYDRHPWVRKVLDSFAYLTPYGAYDRRNDPAANLPDDYKSSNPGGWDQL